MKIPATALMCLALVGCGGSGATGDLGGSGDPDAIELGGSVGANDITGREFEQCSVDDIKATVLNSMQDYYLFYDQLPNLEFDDYATPEDYIRALRVAPFDRFSYVTEQSTSEALFEEGRRFGFGIRMSFNDERRLFFSLVEPLSPFGLANAERGDEILAINGVAVGELTNNFIKASFGEANEAIDITFTLVKRDSGAQVDVTVTKASYEVRTVLDTHVIEHNNHRVGYLRFLSFLETSKDELNVAFATLKNENVDELVLDLRHNTGGRISVAEQLGSQIAGTLVEDTSFTRFAYNDKYSELNSEVSFKARDNTLGLDRLYILTSPDTCSASEMVINSLKPFIEVVTIGDTTCGKPYGTISRNYCGKSINALQVEFLNAANVGGYYKGIPADCPIAQNLTQSLGQGSENLLSAALYHLDTAQCQVSIAAGVGEQSLRSNAQDVSAQRGPDSELMNPDFDEIRSLLTN